MFGQGSSGVFERVKTRSVSLEVSNFALILVFLLSKEFLLTFFPVLVELEEKRVEDFT